MAKDKLISPSFCYILAANFLLFFAFYLILPILPFYLQDQFDADKSMIGFILSCYTIAALCIRPFSGYLLDTFARRPLYLLAYSVFMVIFAGYMIASLLSIFIVLRILHGFAFGMVTVSGNTIVIDILPSSRRGEGIGYYGLANNTAMSFGPMTGLFMHTSFSYETIFACSLLSCLLGFIMAYLVKTPRKQPIKKEPISLDRFFLVKGTWAGISLLLLSIPYGIQPHMWPCMPMRSGFPSIRDYISPLWRSVWPSRACSPGGRSTKGESRWSSRWGCILPPPASSGWQLWKG